MSEILSSLVFLIAKLQHIKIILEGHQVSLLTDESIQLFKIQVVSLTKSIEILENQYSYNIKKCQNLNNNYPFGSKKILTNSNFKDDVESSDDEFSKIESCNYQIKEKEENKNMNKPIGFNTPQGNDISNDYISIVENNLKNINFEDSNVKTLQIDFIRPYIPKLSNEDKVKMWDCLVRLGITGMLKKKSGSVKKKINARIRLEIDQIIKKYN